jgi:uncharacterized membrane protein YcaP (DUF421 family)
MGKSELSKMSPFQLVIIFMIAELAAIPVDSSDASLINGMIAVAILTFLQVLISFISIKSEWFKNFINGKPVMLIERGKLNIGELTKQRITSTDLLEQLRLENCPAISDVEYAILESNGQLSVIPKAKNKPLTPKDMSIPVAEGVLPAIIVSDGHLYSRNLALVGIGEMNFENQLRSVGIDSINNIFLAFCDGDKKLHVYLRDKNDNPFAKEVQL